MRNPKKVRPRRTVDYNGSLARWRVVCDLIMLKHYARFKNLGTTATKNASQPFLHSLLETHSNLCYRRECRLSQALLHTILSSSLSLKFNFLVEIQLLPAKAYMNNLSTSIATKFVHTSTNKIKFPVNVVAVREL